MAFAGPTSGNIAPRLGRMEESRPDDIELVNPPPSDRRRLIGFDDRQMTTKAVDDRQRRFCQQQILFVVIARSSSCRDATIWRSIHAAAAMAPSGTEDSRQFDCPIANMTAERPGECSRRSAPITFEAQPAGQSRATSSPWNAITRARREIGDLPCHQSRRSEELRSRVLARRRNGHDPDQRLRRSTSGPAWRRWPSLDTRPSLPSRQRSWLRHARRVAWPWGDRNALSAGSFFEISPDPMRDLGRQADEASATIAWVGDPVNDSGVA